MTNADERVIKLKHQVLYEVAKLALAGTLEEQRDEIPYTIIPGPLPQYRCCIYKEREIIRQRVRLAEGKSLPGNAPDNVMQVIESACADCPISSYTVTENCQNCLGKACLQACRFGAIEAGHLRSHIDPQKCRECGKCAEACPYNAIAHLVRPCKNACPVNAITYNEYGISVIDETKCIRCGRCIHRCPFAAIGTRTAIVDVIRELKAGRRIYCMMAPATAGQYGPDITINSWRIALEKLGFAGCYDLSLGADLTAAAEAAEWLEAEKRGEQKLTSCCPGFVNMVRLHFPQLLPKVSETVSPMCAMSRMIRAEDPEAVVVFVGPCIAKKSEVLDQKLEGNADYVLTYSEIMSIIRAGGVELEPAEEVCQQGSKYGMGFARSGGVTAAVCRSLTESGEGELPEVCRADGAEECKKALLLLKAGRLPQHFIEGMACQGGCICGPSIPKSNPHAMRDRETVLGTADARGIHESISKSVSADFRMER